MVGVIAVNLHSHSNKVLCQRQQMILMRLGPTHPIQLLLRSPLHFTLPPKEGNTGPHLARSIIGLVLSSAEHITNST